MCLLNPLCLDEAGELLSIGDFVASSHRVLFKHMLKLRSEGHAVDMITLHERLTAEKEMQLVGGPTSIAGLIDGVVQSDSVEPYARLIRQKSQVRSLLRACNRVISMCLEDEDSPTLVDEALQILMRATENQQETGFKHISGIINEYIAKLEAITERGEHLVGIPTGFTDYDLMTLGLQRKELTILAGRPSQGKTTLSYNMAENVARAGYVVAYFSLEMGEEKLGEKSISREARVDSHRLRTGYLNSDEWHRIAYSVERIESGRLFVCDQARLGSMAIRSKSQRLKREQGQLDLIVIDYLQLMAGVPNQRRERHQIVGEYAQDLKAISKELDVSVIALSQLNREAERKDEPGLADLRESGEIEQVADVVSFIYASDEPNVVNLKIGKQRNGPTGMMRLFYDKALNRLTDLENYR